MLSLQLRLQPHFVHLQASLSSAGRGTPRSRSYAARPPIPRGNSNVDHDDAASVAESDDMSVATEDDYREGGAEGESVQVCVLYEPNNLRHTQPATVTAPLGQLLTQ